METLHTNEAMNDKSSDRGRLILSVVIGLFFIFAFWGLRETLPGLHITFYPSWTNSSPGEVYFWLGHVLLLFPGSILVGMGLNRWILPRVLPVWQRVESATPPEQVTVLIAAYVCFFALSRVARMLFLLDYPVTDDEYGLRFGGQILASGKVFTSFPEPQEAFPHLYLYMRDGMLTSFDWIGGLLFSALTELTQSGALLFTILAACPIVCVGYFHMKRLGSGWGLVSIVFLMFSPMFFTLSMTEHMHVLSRAFLSVGFLFYWLAGENRRFSFWFVTGLAFGLSFLCRPFETVFLTLPLHISFLLRLARKRLPVGTSMGGFVLGWLGPLTIFLIYNWLVTGNPFWPARLGTLTDRPVLEVGFLDTLWHRFGSNTSYNLFMLAIWFMGPLGMILVAIGATRDRFMSLLMTCVGCHLLLGLFHRDSGIHIVGPIHYSETAIPLTIVAVHGLHRLVGFLRGLNISARVLVGPVLVVLVVGLGSFTFWHSLALRRHAKVQDTVYTMIENTGIHNAVILAPRFVHVYRTISHLKRTGSWVFDWRRPRPDLDDDILILHDGPKHYEMLRSRFVNRDFYRLQQVGDPPQLTLIRIESKKVQPTEP